MFLANVVLIRDKLELTFAKHSCDGRDTAHASSPAMEMERFVNTSESRYTYGCDIGRVCNAMI